MTFSADIETEVKRIFREQWDVTKTTVVPDTESIALESNEAKELDNGVVLYADLAGSTNMVVSRPRMLAAEVYRAYLYSAAQVIRREGGEVTAYDGDRVMAVFVTNTPHSDAAVSALKINYAVKNIINPALIAQYGKDAYQLKHVVGVDRSSLFIARTGVRGDNDLVWVGRAANYAAKLTEISGDDPSFITGEVFDNMNDRAKLGGSPSRSMWRQRKWTQMSDMRIYSSAWTFAL